MLPEISTAARQSLGLRRVQESHETASLFGYRARVWAVHNFAIDIFSLNIPWWWRCFEQATIPEDDYEMRPVLSQQREPRRWRASESRFMTTYLLRKCSTGPWEPELVKLNGGVHESNEYVAALT